MHKQETINTTQMAALFLSFLTGSAIVNIPAPLTGAAKNSAWLSIWISNAGAMVLLACMLYLHRRFPKLTVIDMFRKAVGNWFAVLVSIPFLGALFLMLANIVLDIGGFFHNTMMVGTPLYATNTLIMMTTALTVRAGIEVMARMFTLILFILYVFVILVILMDLSLYRPEHLLPLFADGMKPVFHGSYIVWGFPYSEIILFTAVLPFIREGKDRKKLGKYMALVILINGLSFFVVVVCTIMALGPLAGEFKYSLFELARLIAIGEFIERVEAVVGFSLIAGSYMKAAIVLFVINLMLSQLWKLKDDRLLIYPIGLVCLLLSLTMFKNEAQFVENVTVVWPLLITTVGVIPVILVTLISFFTRKRA